MNFRFLKSLFKKIVKSIFLISLVAFAISYFQIEKLPNESEMLNELKKDPIQTKTIVQPFEIEKEGITYIIKPLFDYELNGMIVSYHHSSSWLDYYHDKWQDYLNIKDICVIWNENIESGIYKKIDFKNGSYTCYIKSKANMTRDEWQNYRSDNLSNNHLLTNDEEINKKILSAKKGDQIYFKGYLVEYSIKDDDFKRGSSISRTDNGNGACETIFIEDFQILKRANPLERDIHNTSKYLLLGSFLILTVLFFKDI
ncbi:MAG: hypothetical protein P1P85_04960 [Patescibacteria group bacterium]|nr:hypothetical protein [Patescibacteria group bacterium]